MLGTAYVETNIVHNVSQRLTLDQARHHLKNRMDTLESQIPSLQKELEELTKYIQTKAVVCIQRFYQGYRGRQLFKMFLLAREIQQAIQIQRIYRGFVAKIRVEELREQQRQKSATLIQAGYRGHLGRIRAFKMRYLRYWQAWIVPRPAARIKIQSFARMILAYQEKEVVIIIRKEMDRRELMRKAATLIQKVVRLPPPRPFTHTYTYIRTYIHAHTHTLAHGHTHTHGCIHAYIRTHTHT